MAGTAKFATQEMKDQVAALAADISNQPGPLGVYEDMVNGGLIPAELPCEAYGLWDYQGYLHAAASTDGMNGWYFHCYATELPYWSEASYTAQDPNGSEIQVNEGELMGMFVAGSVNYFYINGTGVSIHVFSTSPAVRTEERMGLDKIGPYFPNAAVDARGALPDKIAKHTGPDVNPFYYTNPPQ